MKILLYSLLFLFIVIGCSNEEKLIDNTTSAWKMLVADQGTTPTLKLCTNEGDIISQNIYQEHNGKELPGVVSKMAEFGGNIYLLITDKNMIEVISSETYKTVVTYEFPGKPFGITFPNATDAYVSLTDANKVALVDVYYMKIADYIDVAGEPTGIASYGNQVYVANSKNKSISVIDTRTKNVETTIKVADYPMYIDFTPDGTKALVISTGAGKNGTGEGKTPAIATFIDVAQRTISMTTELGIGTYQALEQLPNGMTITGDSWAFIPTNDMFMRLDTRFGDRKKLVYKGEFYSVIWNFKRSELLVFKNTDGKTEAFTADPVTGVRKADVILPMGARAVLPL